MVSLPAVDIEDKIRKGRHMSIDGSKAIYDLSGLDFSNTRLIAEAIAKIMWQDDLSKWQEEDEMEMTFRPKYELELLLPHKATGRLKRTAEEIEHDESMWDFWHAPGLRSASTGDREKGWATVLLMSAIWSYLKKLNASDAEDGHGLAQLYNELSSHLSVMI